MGVPRYLHGHHLMGVRRQADEVRAAGMVTRRQLASELGIGATTLARYEGVLWPAPARYGTGQVRAYPPELADKVRAAIKSLRRTKKKGAIR
ncbi:hypothetical protein [Sorangium sp. So ce1024]|uniref:hypothetical protein n=1 Tax=Sorangium sp. So ce1024 TaxID=3133327 RepID=UPI003F08E36B